jgi:hypothetical protein
MRRTSARVLVLSLVVLAPAVAATPSGIAVARAGLEDPEDGRKQIADAVAALRESVSTFAKYKGPMPDFAGVVRGIDALDAEVGASGPKDRAKIARALADAFVALLPTTTSGTLGASALAYATAAIGKCGDAGATLLLGLLKTKDIEQKVFALVAVHEGLGQAGTDVALDALLDSARKREVPWLHCAGAGFAASTVHDGKRRQKAFESLLSSAKALRDERARKGKKLEDEPGGRDMLAAVGSGLAALARAEARDLSAWEAWSKERGKDAWTDGK